ncbi:MAG: Rieske 2Fe-2S domain-containing protein [Planctomycetaceae bacterium]|nr:Rieske 2Fe-2S domain-containing protein [Planctomycetales bacterium]MCB9926997.1 Rieske 2Fe-2S domain-containing protein [Planctomycetaceae bacterium]
MADSTPDVAEHSEESSDEDRRGFVTRLLAVVCGGIAGAVPFLSGLVVILDPLRRRADGQGFLRVTTLDSVPDDGIARYFPVVTDRTDAWNRYLDEPIGAVFLRREPGSSELECLNAICPHAGCFVDFNIAAKQFQCPCHDSNFESTGKRLNPDSCPSPRDLDTLEVDPERLKAGEVFVNFKNFLTATPEKVEKE